MTIKNKIRIGMVLSASAFSTAMCITQGPIGLITVIIPLTLLSSCIKGAILDKYPHIKDIKI